MRELFLRAVNMSVSASWIILAVLGLRLVLKKVPKGFRVLLWGIAAVRLLFPIAIESPLSLMPSTGVGADPAPVISSGTDAVGNLADSVVGQAFASANGAGVYSMRIAVCAGIWMLGVAVLLAYGIISYWQLRRRVGTAVFLRSNVFQCDSVVSPCVLGIIRPRIYLPFKMDVQKLEHVIAHERAHIRRGDHWWKSLGFLLLTIHWFNPLVWLAYVLLCRDIELACDEKVIKELDSERRADYTQALVACSMNRRTIAACPLAFGEVGVKERVKSIMNYKKPALWINILAAISCAAVAVCFLTNPVKATKALPPDGPYAQIIPEKAIVTDIDAGDEEPMEQMDAERLASMEAEVNALKEELARLQAEYEEMIEAERG